MIAIDLEDVKSCMSKILLSDSLDSFLFIEGEITTFCTFKYDGYLEKKFFEDPDSIPAHKKYVTWGKMRDYCFSVIKGKRTPLNFQFVFSLSEEQILSFLTENGLGYKPEDIGGLHMNIRYDGEHLGCVTATTMQTFTMDKSVEHAFDEWVKKMWS